MASRSKEIWVKPLALAAYAGFFAFCTTASANDRDEQAARRAVIEARLKPVRPSQKKLTLTPGDTLFLETTVRVPAARIGGRELDYESLVSGVVSPSGVVVHRRVHEYDLRPRGSEVEVRFVYAIHADPSTTTGGQVRLTVMLVERLGLANTLAKKEIVHQVEIERSRPTPREVAADFYGYRYYRRVAERARKTLARAGLRLSFKDQDRLPPLDRAPEKVAAGVLAYDRARRLMWVAHRHLIAAMQHPDSKTRRLAQAYLRNLDRPRSQWQGVPSVPLVDPAAPAAPRADGGATPRRPTSERPVDAPRRPRDPSRPERLEPSTEYELGTERTPPPPPVSRAPAPPEAPGALQGPEAPQASGSEPPSGAPAEEGDEADVIYEDDPFGDQARRRLTRIPSYYRGLVLDDPNIAYGAAIRGSYASIETRESANTGTVFYFAQAAVSRTVGIEVTVPTQYLDITSFPNDRNPPAQYEVGNPLVAVKYRLQLPEVQGRRPALVLKARWGIPLVPLHGVPATDLIVEDFTREVNFVDTYAFFLENHDFGLGANFVWRWRWLYTGFQFFTDVFVPVDGASQDSTFTALSYGATVGGLPFGDVVGFFVEGRGTTLLLGGGRNEFFTYLGARGRVFDYVEPAVWVGLPLGSIREVSPIQVGIELRFSYDVDDVLEPRRIRRQQDILE